MPPSSQQKSKKRTKNNNYNNDETQQNKKQSLRKRKIQNNELDDDRKIIVNMKTFKDLPSYNTEINYPTKPTSNIQIRPRSMRIRAKSLNEKIDKENENQKSNQLQIQKEQYKYPQTIVEIHLNKDNMIINNNKVSSKSCKKVTQSQINNVMVVINNSNNDQNSSELSKRYIYNSKYNNRIAESLLNNDSKKQIHSILVKNDANTKQYQQAIEILQEYSLPNEIPCRDKEKQQIKDFIITGIENNGSSHSLYISGVPGIGKTASLLEVMRDLEQDKKYKDKYKFVHLNGLSMSNPENAYSQLMKELFDIKNISRTQSCLVLNEIFTQGKLSKKFQFEISKNYILKNKIILLDELDYFLTQDQSLLYNLFEWPHHKNSRITMIGIANTMDFPERLKHKIASRIGNQRLVFNPYTSQQIAQIIQTRLKGLEDVFQNMAIQYVSKKIAVSSSDIRRTLNVCRKSVEICQAEYRKEAEESKQPELKKVKIDNIIQAYNLLYDRPYHKCIKSFSKFHKVLLISIALEVKSRGGDYAYLSDTYDRCKLMASNLGWSQFQSSNEVKIMLAQFESLSLMSLKEKLWISKRAIQSQNNNQSGDKVEQEKYIQQKNLEEILDPNKKKYYNLRDQQIILNIQVDDVTNALRDDEIFLKFKDRF